MRDEARLAATSSSTRATSGGEAARALFSLMQKVTSSTVRLAVHSTPIAGSAAVRVVARGGFVRTALTSENAIQAAYRTGSSYFGAAETDLLRCTICFFGRGPRSLACVPLEFTFEE
ncbi:hypothetical protein NUM_36610 [Actinocatenispora comari]|uniref:Uncharacterized protein n=1 Tax=Actinocatenispora comari TaxID=2807577 RepID=A0A8J4AEU8_9ACTN|nr:hypothetical protein NUM_36610 [Actinocatenispora comari]